MAQLMYFNPSVTSIGASRFLTATSVASNGQLPVQSDALTGSAKQINKILEYQGGSLDTLLIEHPLTITYLLSCQQNNCMIYVSPQIANLGFTPEAWLGKPDLRLQRVHKEDLERVEKAFRHSHSTAEKLSCHYRFYDSAEKMHWFHDETNVVCDESGDPLFIMGAMRDITDMKVMETELNEHRYYLEQKVEQRTKQLERKITLLESCNTTLCSKLAQAKRDITALQKQLNSTLSGRESNDCSKQLTGISEQTESGVKHGWVECTV